MPCLQMSISGVFFFHNIPLRAEFEFEFLFSSLYVCIDDGTIRMSWFESICARGGRDGSLGVTWSCMAFCLLFSKSGANELN